MYFHRNSHFSYRKKNGAYNKRGLLYLKKRISESKNQKKVAKQISNLLVVMRLINYNTTSIENQPLI